MRDARIGNSHQPTSNNRQQGAPDDFNETPLALSVGLLSVTLTAGIAHADYPEKPIELIVPWSAGGGTDAVARQFANGLEEELDRTVNVVNRTGGSGVVGHTAMANADPDGYTLGLVTAEITTYRHIGSSDISYGVPRP
ncbi:Bug family tripartite tricarboxylate transporter substrate binding protein [Aidingimonas halophila]|uniref:Tripartite tricarboxylate transporter family receptor n=1 Tax=Aidingimonas halophila TaxID=574349 RepID=A0A1H2X086_9GAMM|nr:hypothetical protein GCM10008094_19480 [Aidingimonas halophila]SDW86323.1 Tripartite tricarboxylate transporter family receptor [Aidingimonas halophila]